MVRVQVSVIFWQNEPPFSYRKDFTGFYLFGDEVDLHLMKAEPEFDGWKPGFVTKLPPYFEGGNVVMPPDVHGNSWVIDRSKIGPVVEVRHKKITEKEEKEARGKLGQFCEENKEGVQVVSTTNAQSPVGHGG